MPQDSPSTIQDIDVDDVAAIDNSTLNDTVEDPFADSGTELAGEEHDQEDVTTDNGYHTDEDRDSQEAYVDDDTMCRDCGEDHEVCERNLCEQGHCRGFCPCDKCWVCGETHPACECNVCTACDRKPFHCDCFPHWTRRVQVDSQGRGFNFFRVDPGDDRILLRGDMLAVIAIGHPYAAWREDLKAAIGRVLKPTKTAKDYFETKLIKEPKEVYNQYKKEKAWEIYRKECERVVKLDNTHKEDFTYVYDAENMQKMLTKLAALPPNKPYISFDMEANNLGHSSPLCTIQIRDNLNEHSYLVDLLVLGKKAFTTTSLDGTKTFKDILESPDYQKLIFDVRQDSCTLFANAGVKLQGCIDIQVMYLLTYDWPPTYRSGMAGVAELVCDLPADAMAKWQANKSFRPSSHKMWEQRPLSAQAKAYAIGDVEVLYHMHERIHERLNETGRKWALDWTAVEVEKIWCKAEEWKSSRQYTTYGFRDCWGNICSPISMRVGPPFCRPRPRIVYESDYDDDDW